MARENSNRHLQNVANPALQSERWLKADDMGRRLAVDEDDQCRCSLDTEALGYPRAGFDVHAADTCDVSQLVHEFPHDRCHRETGCAPRRPELQQSGWTRGLEKDVDRAGVDGLRVVHRRVVQAPPDEAVIEVDCAGFGMLAAAWRLDLQAGRCMCRPAVESERSAIVARRRAHRHQARPPNIAASRVRIRTSGNLEPGTIVRDDETRPLVTSTIEPAILRRSALVAAFVGPVLTLVNQTEAVFGQRPLETGRALLTLIVPFLVASASGAMASRRALRASLARERDLIDLVDPLRTSVETIRSNAATVNATARTRREETAVLHQRARQASEDVDGGAALVQHALEATAEVQKHFGAVIEAEALVQAEVRSSAGSAVAVSSAVAVARGKFSEISALAHDIGRLGHQTTLLSLNAAVVAATAGAEGKRFAAIAESIRELARETEAQAKKIDTTTRDLERSASEMATETDRLRAGTRRLLECSETSRLALGRAAGSMERSASPTRACLDLLAAQGVQIRAIAEGIGHVVGHAEAAIEGSARNMALAAAVGDALGDLVQSSHVVLRTGRS